MVCEAALVRGIHHMGLTYDESVHEICQRLTHCWTRLKHSRFTNNLSVDRSSLSCQSMLGATAPKGTDHSLALTFKSIATLF